MSGSAPNEPGVAGMRRLDTTLPADARQVRSRAGAVRAAVAEALDAARADDLEQAVAEALANAVEHGSRAGDTVRVQVDVVSDSVEVRVVDAGHGEIVWPPAPDRPRPGSESERGRGLALLHRLADEVEIRHEDGRRATVVRVRRPGRWPGERP